MIFFLILLFDEPGSFTNVNYFSFSGFSASRLLSKFFLVLCSVGFETTFNLRSMGNEKNLDYEHEGV